MKSRLVARGTFEASERAIQRLYYKGQRGDLNYHVDLVPFGTISQEKKPTAWPPDMKVIMNVVGYDDALASAELVSFAPGLDGKVVSLAGLAILKLLAWSDRGRENPKDAYDLIHLMNRYADAGNFDRVYDEDGVIAAGNDDAEQQVQLRLRLLQQGLG